MPFNPGFAIRWNDSSAAFEYGDDVFGPLPEHRRLDAIRASLRDANCLGPDPVYSIAMDVGRHEDATELHRRMLLFGVVTYYAGCLGQEPVRSQGHAHSISPHSGWSAPELFEIWEGNAIIYAQQFDREDPGCCVAVEAAAGDRVVVPPGWVHCVINGDPGARMVFGAWCDREYGFVYDGVRARGGVAWFPVLSEEGRISWQPNPRYRTTSLNRRQARSYPELGLGGETPIYEQFVRNPDSVQWVSDPARFAGLWSTFQP